MNQDPKNIWVVSRPFAVLIFAGGSGLYYINP